MSRPLILAVDDEEPVRRLLELGLPPFGLDVLTAASGSEAIALYRARGPEIAAVLLDDGLPDMLGLDALTEMRQINPALPACFITGWGSSAPEGRLSAFPVVRKPFMLAKLAETLREVIG